MANTVTTHPMAELAKEATLGGMGFEVERQIPRIDMSHFADRKGDVADQLWAASIDIGFFQVYNHGIEQAVVDRAFAFAERFFTLPTEIKAKYPLVRGTNAGWESSPQLLVKHLRNTGVSAEPGYQLRANSGHLFLRGLAGGKRDAFADLAGGGTLNFASPLRGNVGSRSARERADAHYLGMENAKPEDFELWRAGAHSDFDCLTFLHQRPGQGGLQVCPGKDAAAHAWTSVEPEAGYITCNIGDMLMRWSDDQLQSTLHRVRMPRSGEYLGPRLSLPFFCQANKDAIIQGPGKKYAPITARDYLQQRIAANFAK
jgi:isopenicillin N synthase-like dioxygenase